MSERTPAASLLAVIPMDVLGHLECTYTDADPNCGCYALHASLVSWLAAHDEAVRAEEREKIAASIEADMTVRPLAGHDGIRDAAIIARAGGAS